MEIICFMSTSQQFRQLLFRNKICGLEDFDYTRVDCITDLPHQRFIFCLRGFANNKGAEQPALPCSLISALVIRSLKSIIPRLATR